MMMPFLKNYQINEEEKGLLTLSNTNDKTLISVLEKICFCFFP